MEVHDPVPSTGKQPRSVGARAPGFGPDGRLRGGGGCSRSRERDVSPRDCFAARLVWLAAGRSLGSGGAQGRAGRRAASRMLPGPGRRVYVCARWGGARRVHGTGGTRASAGARRRGRQHQRRRVKIPHKTRARTRAPRRVGGEPSIREKRTPRPEIQSVNREPQHQQTGKDAGQLSTHPGRGTSPKTGTRPGRQSAHPHATWRAPRAIWEPQRGRVLRGKVGACPG